MKKMSLTLKVLALAGAISFGAASLFAADAPPTVDNQTAGAKFTRGIVGLVFGWLELPNQMYQSAVNDGPGMAVTVGFAKGLGMTCARYLCSTYEFLTFPFPINDFKPVMDQEYPWGYLAAEGNVTVPAATSASQPVR
ncbi:MAG: exosortase system-associated protein, TIGR04073 family [Verrucomicrobia bacterium]|nr:exosortase system-associated protein, TIGR04073 family [Verrucomicrobiota bacterium]